MNKKELIIYINQKHIGSLSSKNTSYSNINKSKDVWWFNISVSKFQGNVNLLLNDTNKVIWIHLPKGFVNNVSSHFKIRQDKDVVDLEISADRNNKYLVDVKSGGIGFDFKEFIKGDKIE